MRTRIITLLLSLCSFVFWAVNVNAQNGKVTYTGETSFAVGSKYYLQNVKTGKFMKAPSEMVDKWTDATEFTVTVADKNQVRFSEFACGYKRGVFSFELTDKVNWQYKRVLGTTSLVIYAAEEVRPKAFFHLDENGGITKINDTACDTTDVSLMWKVVTKKQLIDLDTDTIAKNIHDKGKLSFAIKTEWDDAVSTIKNEDNWYPYAENATFRCLSIYLKGFKKGYYIVEFYGMTNKERNTPVVVECMTKGMASLSSCSKAMSKTATTYSIPIEVSEDDAILNVYVNAGTVAQNIWGYVKSVRKIDDNQYHTLMAKWTPEEPTAGEFYIYNAYKNQVFLGSNSTHLQDDAKDATRFTLSGKSSATISYQDNGEKYVNRDGWSSNSYTWNIEGDKTNGYLIKNTDNEKIAINVDKIDYLGGSAGDNNRWSFISKDQYYAVYPTERIVNMLNQNGVTVERDMSHPFDVKNDVFSGVWSTSQKELDVNNKYTIKGLNADTYIVQVYAKKGNNFEANIVVKCGDNIQSQAITTKADFYTFKVAVASGATVEIYEDAPNGAGELSLAIKKIATEASVKSNLANLFIGEEIGGNAFYIHNVAANTYLKGNYKSSQDIFGATSYVFDPRNKNNYYWIINSDDNAKLTHSGHGIGDNDADWSYSEKNEQTTFLGKQYSFYYNSILKHFYWANNSGNVSLADKSGAATPFRLISENQFNALFPEKYLQGTIRNSLLEAFRCDVSGISLEKVGDVWMVKNTISRSGNYQKIVINNLEDKKYVVTMYGINSNATASIKAQVGANVSTLRNKLDDDKLSESLQEFTDTIEVVGGTLILYVDASKGDVYSAIKSIVPYADNVGDNSNITWTEELLANGDFRLLNVSNHVFLHNDGNASKLDNSNSTLFHFNLSSSNKASFYFGDSSYPTYVWETDGIGAWGSSPQTWTFDKQTKGYYISHDNRKIRYRTNYGLSYDTGVSGEVCQWQLISDDQYQAVSPVCIAERFESLGSGVSAKWETPIKTSKDGFGVWSAVSDMNDSDECNKITFNGLNDGYYDVQVQVKMANWSTAAVVAESKTKVSRTVSPESSYTYSLPVLVEDGVLSIYIDASKCSYSVNVYSLIKDIVPITSDAGVMDAYIKNPYFKLPEGEIEWNDGWTVQGFEPAAGSDENGMSKYAIHPEIKVLSNCMNNFSNSKVSQTIKLKAGVYVLSADAFTKGSYRGILYAKVGTKPEETVYCSGSLERYTVSFEVKPEDGKDSEDVEVGFKLGDNPTGESGECIIAADNFRLMKTTNLLQNPLFSDETNHWVTSNVTWTNKGNSQMSTTNFVEGMHPENGDGTTIDAGFVEQKVTLPVGAYKLSAKALVWNTIGCLYAKLKLGDEYKTQKTYIVQDKEWGDEDKELIFVVPAECEVTVGMSFDKVEGDTDPRYLGGKNIRFQADEFSLIRIGEVENTDISCQIANNDFSSGRNENENEKERNNVVNIVYGWEKSDDKFSDYKNGVAIRNDNTKGIQIAQVVSGLPNGWYKIEAQGFDEFTSQSSTLMFANGSYTNVASSKEVSGVNPTSDPATTFSNYPSNYMNDLVVHVDDGQITLGVERDNTIGDSDFSAFNYFKLYYLYEESVFADVTNFIKNPSFETGSRLGWDSNMTKTQASSASAGDSWDKNYYFAVDANKYIQQVVKGVPAGTYKLSAQIKADGGKDVTLSANEKDTTTNSSSIEDIYVIFDVKDGEDITIKATSSGKFSIDNFRLKSAIEEVYLYNADAGMFFGEEKATGYDIVKYERYPVGLSLNGTMLKMTEKGNDLYTFQNSEDKYIVVDKVRSRDDDYKYTFYSTDDSHSEFKKTMINSEACNLCINPADGRFGTNARTQNEGFASSYVKKYGTTYMGWSGEAGFDVVLPLIPEADKNDRGVNWQVLTKEQYETYGEIIKNAYSARMEAWPILCAARRSKMPVDYTELEYLYSKISSTGAAISKSAEAIRKQIMESGLYLDAATKDNSLDLTFLMPDADCKQKDVAWNNTDGLFKSCETTDYMAEGTFGGRYYKVQDIEGLQNTELSYEFTGLPEGRYVMSFKVLAYNVSGNTTNGVEVFAKTIDIDTITENVIANSYAIQRVYTPEFVVDENSTATVGIKLNGTNANLIAIDDVRILYYGKSESNIDTYKYKVTDGVVRFMGTWTNDDKAKDKMKR